MDEITCVRGEAFVVSDITGDVVRGGDNGMFVRDTRMLDQFELLVDGRPPQPLVGSASGVGGATFHCHVPLEGRGPDPVLLVDRRRIVDGAVHEEVRLHNRSPDTLHVEVSLQFGTDFAYIFDVRHGRRLPSVPSTATPDGLRFVRADGVDVLVVSLDPPPDRWEDDGVLVLSRTLAPRSEDRICIDVVTTDVYGTQEPRSRCAALDRLALPARLPVRAHEPVVRCADRRVERLVETALRDLDALRVTDPEDRSDAFFAAGSPWYLTLFGRDSIWAALMALPFTPSVAAGTLRALARRQGQRDDPGTEEEPGKILHEIRRGSLTHRGDLPPNYYGTIDATPLFVVLANEAWRWGMPEEQVSALMPHVEAALGWLERSVGRSDDGFLSYERHGSRGLVNQGWKDSHDGVQSVDGELARAPISLAEVQGYAHDAAVRGAELLDRFGRPGGDRWRDWAQELQGRFRAAFWAQDTVGRYPVIALDRDGQQVSGATSNMGHLPATGILDDQESARVAARLTADDLADGWGLRTMSRAHVGFNPLAYHAGSVWPHDTAIAASGLARRGNHAEAGHLFSLLVDAAPSFDYRLPELYAGHARADAVVPVPHPAACRPQAWSAAAGLLLARACLGLEPEVPNGRLVVAPMCPPPFGRISITGLRLGDRVVSVSVGADAGVEVEIDGPALDVVVRRPADHDATRRSSPPPRTPQE